MNQQVIAVAERALQDIFALHDTGAPYVGHHRVDHVVVGMTLKDITWTMDRGNWTWDGVLLALTAVGVDVTKPLLAGERLDTA